MRFAFELVDKIHLFDGENWGSRCLVWYWTDILPDRKFDEKRLNTKNVFVGERGVIIRPIQRTKSAYNMNPA